MAKILTQKEREERNKKILAEHKAGVSTKALVERFGLNSRTIERIIYPKARPRGKQIRKAALPSTPGMPGKIRKSAFLPRMKNDTLNPENLPSGATLAFNKAGELRRVERCPIYGPRYSSWLVGTVEVGEVKDGVIHGTVHRWDGESITGQLVFDKTRAPYFYYDRLPAKAEVRSEKVKEELAARIRRYRLKPASV